MPLGYTKRKGRASFNVSRQGVSGGYWLGGVVPVVMVLMLGMTGCGSSASPAPPTVAPDPARAAAERDCPERYASDCIPIYFKMAAGSMPAELCVWPDYRWSFVTPGEGERVGDYGCGSDGKGQVVAIVGGE